MCNIAGYIGTRPAAPILIEMLRKQEGFDSGFYTGIATIHEGKIYYAKVVGDLKTLLKETNAAELPGTIGFIHGRTPGAAYQDREWAHPLTTIRDGEVAGAYILNGTSRYFDKFMEQKIAAAERVRADGYPFRSEVHMPDAKFCLADGTTMHPTEVLCNIITRNVDRGMDTVKAIAEAVYEFPSESVSMYLSPTRPDGVTFARVNFPLHLNFVEHGAYLATTPMAFPEDAGEPVLLPAMSSGFITKDSLLVKPFEKHLATIAPLDSKAYHDLYEVIYEALHREEGINLYTPLGDIHSYFDEADLIPSGAAKYRILYDINRKEPLKIRTEYKPGQKEGLTAPVFYVSL